MEIDIKTTLAGIEFGNPVFTASGTCGFGREYLPYYSISELGALVTKGLSVTPREGNSTPRVAETPSGMLNAIGLQNPGIDYFIKNELPNIRKYKTKLIVNFFGNTEEEYIQAAELFSEQDIDAIEMNISCPNVDKGGVHFGTNPKAVESIVSKVKRVSKKPLIVKLSPNVTDITEIAKAAEGAGSDILSMINTLIGMRIDIKTRRPVLANNTGGLSGAAIKPVAVRMVYQVRKAVNIPIIGMGGIRTANDAIEFILAGASAVAIGTASFANPMTVIEVREGIKNYLIQNKIEKLSDIIGAVVPW